jgi:hypothetical protein
MDHGGFAQAATHGEHDGTQATAGDESNPGQSQRDLQAAEKGGAAAEQHGKHGSPKDETTHGQPQRDLQDANDGTVVTTQHSRHGAPEDGSNPAQQQRDVHASENGSGAAAPHARDDARPASEANSGQSHREVHQPSVNASTNPHAGSSQHAGDKGQAGDAPGPAQKAAAPELGDSFHFRSDIAASNASSVSEVHGGHGPDPVALDLHAAGNGGLAQIQVADLIGPSHAEQSAADHAKGGQHHLTHDLFV